MKKLLIRIVEGIVGTLLFTLALLLLLFHPRWWDRAIAKSRHAKAMFWEEEDDVF